MKLWGLALLLWMGLTRADDLLQVWAQARGADPLLAQAQALRGVSQADADAARAPLLPQANLSASEVRGDNRQGGVTASLSQTLYDPAQWREWDATRSLASAQAARTEAAEQTARQRVAEAYFGVLSAQAMLATARANDEAFERQVNEARERFKAGLSAAVEVEQSRAYAELARGASLAAESQLADAREALAQLTGQAAPALKPLSARFQAVRPEGDALAWAERALAANPALRASALGLQASEQRIDGARARHGPTLSVGVDSSQLRGPAVADRSPQQLTLRFTLPLFAGGGTEAASRRAVAQRDAAREQLEADRRALLREVRAQHQTLRQGPAELRATQAAVDAAQAALAATRTGLTLGTRSTTDLLLAIQTLAAAQNAQTQARHRQVLALLALHRAAGSLGDAELAAVNQWLGD